MLRRFFRYLGSLFEKKKIGHQSNATVVSSEGNLRNGSISNVDSKGIAPEVPVEFAKGLASDVSEASNVVSSISDKYEDKDLEGELSKLIKQDDSIKLEDRIVAVENEWKEKIGLRRDAIESDPRFFVNPVLKNKCMDFLNGLMSKNVCEIASLIK
ncbi:MAG: hypothetical protein LBC92_03745 [Rickettsiales bacterium]|jgi:hypothetical protein|nr:hypothetical protein [Rickettsiales bacterium]